MMADMDGISSSACVGEEWTWNIVIETMNKLTIEINSPIPTKQSCEDVMKIKQKGKLMEASHGSSTAIQATFHPVQFSREASKDPSEISNMMNKLETVLPSDFATSSSLFRDFDPLQFEEERKRKYQRFRSSNTSQMRTLRVTPTEWRSKEISTRVHSGNGGRRAGGNNNVRRK